MTPAHHPSTALIARYATGHTAVEANVVIGAHLEICAQCAAKVRSIEAAEGALLAALPDAPLAPGALERVMDRLEPVEDRREPDPLFHGVRLPHAVAAAGLRTRRSLGRQFWTAQVRTPRQDGWRLVLLHASAGSKVPWHVDRGEELIAVLSGGLRDGDEVHEAGDFSEHGPAGGHALQALDDGPCVCLIAAQGQRQWSFPAGMAAWWLGL